MSSKTSMLFMSQLGAVQFIILTLIAMLIYPGGSMLNPTSEHYSFHNNFFSDLGRTKSISGEENMEGYVLFTTAMIIAGASITLLFKTSGSLYNGEVFSLATKLGMLSGLFIALTGIIPVDTQLHWHQIMIFTGFLLTFLAVGIYSFQFLKTKNEYQINGKYLSILSFIILIYLGIMLWGPKMDTYFGLTFQVMAQKFVVYCLIIILFIHSSSYRSTLLPRNFFDNTENLAFIKKMELQRQKIMVDFNQAASIVLRDLPGNFR
ncbi:MAG: hypothetical protein INQ03_15835 [Candidatus Heimdallarchaeota archaeon]|nr:hypothetical protein [Candidatus Heimdallarchaeota archaeon]